MCIGVEKGYPLSLPLPQVQTSNHATPYHQLRANHGVLSALVPNMDVGRGLVEIGLEVFFGWGGDAAARAFVCIS